MNIALKLSILRTVRSQVQLAALTGIREDRISRIVNGWASPTAHERRQIARFVGQSERVLFDDPQPEQPPEAASA